MKISKYVVLTLTMVCSLSLNVANAATNSHKIDGNNDSVNKSIIVTEKEHNGLTASLPAKKVNSASTKQTETEQDLSNINGKDAQRNN